MLVTVLSIREIVPVLCTYLRARDVVMLNTVSHVVRSEIAPFVHGMKINETIVIGSRYTSVEIRQSSIPQLNKRTIHSASVVYGPYSITATKVNEIEDSRAVTLKLVSDCMDLRYLYVFDGITKYVIVPRRRATGIKLEIRDALVHISLHQMLEYIIRDFWDASGCLCENEAMGDLIDREYGLGLTLYSRIQPALESSEFLRFMVSFTS